MEATAVGLTAILSITPSVIMLLCRSTGFRNLSIWKKSRHTIASYHRVIPSRHLVQSPQTVGAKKKPEKEFPPAQAMLTSQFQPLRTNHKHVTFDSGGRHDDVVILRLPVGEITKFLSNNVHRFRSFDSDTNRVGTDAHNRDRNVITDQNPLTCLSGQY